MSTPSTYANRTEMDSLKNKNKIRLSAFYNDICIITSLVKSVLVWSWNLVEGGLLQE